MAASVKHNAHEVAVFVYQTTPEIERELEAEHTRQVQAVARKMREKAAKGDFLGTLRESIHVEARSRLDAIVVPGTDYAVYREKGTRPGRGLPRYTDPDAGDIVRWLESKAFAKTRAPRRSSKKAVQRNLELRDRYQGLSWHVYHFGTKASPFVEPTAREMAPVVAAAFRVAVERGIARAGGKT